MLQTHYVENDEEITSLVDRLRKSKSAENFFIIPQRSMVFQSLVNLKLFRRESQKMKKKICLVTQNEFILSLAKKAGVETKNSIGGIQPPGEDTVKIQEPASAGDIKISGRDESEVEKKKRLGNIGTSDFYSVDASPPLREKQSISDFTKQAVKKRETEAVLKKTSPEPLMKMDDMLPVKKENPVASDALRVNFIAKTEIDIQKQKKLESLFGRKSDPLNSEKKEELLPGSSFGKKKPEFPAAKVPGGFRKMMLLFVLVCALILGTVSAYLYLPKAEVEIFPAYQKVSADFEVRNYEDSGKQGLEISGVEVIEIEEAVRKSFEATGRSGSAGKKAKGKIVIFNEFSADSQPLVATTRFLSEEKKLFRLDKGVVVPGMSGIEGELKPGAVEAEVTADEPGEDYNIGPNLFTIPGFEGGQKYEKFYAKSEKPITGGGYDETASRSVGQADIEKAREESEKSLEEKMKKILTEKIEEGYVSVPGAEKFSVAASEASARAGDLAESFEYSATGSLLVYVVNMEEIKKHAREALEAKHKNLENMKPSRVDIEIRQPEFNFEERKLALKIHVQAAYVPAINLEEFREEILGKNEQEITEIASKKGTISEIKIYHWPSFITSRIPQYKRQVSVKLVEDVDSPKNQEASF